MKKNYKRGFYKIHSNNYGVYYRLFTKERNKCNQISAFFGEDGRLAIYSRLDSALLIIVDADRSMLTAFGKAISRNDNLTEIINNALEKRILDNHDRFYRTENRVIPHANPLRYLINFG